MAISPVQQHIVPLYHLELVREKDIPYRNVAQVEAAAEVFHEMLDSAPIEKMAVIHCNSGMDMIGAEYVAVGSMEAVGAAMADLYRGAIKNNAARIWMAHNHVDGRTKASPQDFGYSLRALDAGDMLGVPLHDHLVIGPGSYYSIFSHPADFEAGIRTLELQAMSQMVRKGLGERFPKRHF